MQYVITQIAETRGRDSIVCPTKHLVFLDLDAGEVFCQPGMIFSDGNAARLSDTSFYTDPAHLRKLDWETINCPGDYHGSSGKCYNREWKRKKASEVLVPEKVPAKYISRIVVYDENAAEELANKIQAARMDLCHPIKCDMKTVSKYYF
jgi:ssDNA thymidine ADP-ribosyltransferase DarT-like protein